MQKKETGKRGKIALLRAKITELQQ